MLLNKSGKNNVALTANVVNNGEAGLQNFQVTLLWSLNNGPFQTASTYTIATLPAMGTTAITYDAPGLAGQNHYRVEIDPLSTELDEDRSNNVADQYLVIQGLPDLTVSKVGLSKAPAIQGVPVSVTALVSNIGIAAANNVLVEVFDGPPGTGKLLNSTILSQVAALSSVPVSIPIDTTKLAVGRNVLWVVVDRNQSILEALQTNNTASAVISVLTADKTPPTSAVLLLPAVEPNPQFKVSWSGKDNAGGSGIAFYDIYESTNGGKATLWLSKTTATSATFTGQRRPDLRVLQHRDRLRGQPASHPQGAQYHDEGRYAADGHQDSRRNWAWLSDPTSTSSRSSSPALSTSRR